MALNFFHKPDCIEKPEVCKIVFQADLQRKAGRTTPYKTPAKLFE